MVGGDRPDTPIRRLPKTLARTAGLAKVGRSAAWDIWCPDKLEGFKPKTYDTADFSV